MLGSIGAAVYRRGVAAGLPAGVPPEAAATALDTLGGAVDVAQHLPDPVGLALLGVARDAFVQGLHLAAAISAVVAIAAAIMAMALLRQIPARSEMQEPADLEDDAAGGVGDRPALRKQEADHAA